MTTENKEELLRLYKLLWEQIKNLNDIKSGLCYIAANCDTDFVEHKTLLDHIHDNMPKIPNYEYGWHFNKQGTADRKAFVQRMIKELENQN